MACVGHVQRLPVAAEGLAGEVHRLRRHFKVKTEIFHLTQGHEDRHSTLLHYVKILSMLVVRLETLLDSTD